MKLRKRMRPLSPPDTRPPESQALLKELLTEERAWCAAYKSVNRRYYLATTGIKCVPVSLVLSVVIGLGLILAVPHNPKLGTIVVALFIAMLPLLVGTAFIAIGDLLKAEEAQRVMDAWFRATKSPGDGEVDPNLRTPSI